MNHHTQPLQDYDPLMAQNNRNYGGVGGYGGDVGSYGGGGALEAKLMSCDNGVVIRQKVDRLEIMTGLERQNVYHAYKAGQLTEKGAKKKGQKIFKFKEKSTFWQRCVAGSCKRFGVKCMQYDDEDEENDKQVVLRAEKECQCTYFCYNRTEIKVYACGHENSGGEYIGRVYDPWDICNFGFQIYDKADVPIYGLKAS